MAIFIDRRYEAEQIVLEYTLGQVNSAAIPIIVAELSDTLPRYVSRVIELRVQQNPPRNDFNSISVRAYLNEIIDESFRLTDGCEMRLEHYFSNRKLN